jgi:hypothetical protein
LAELGGFEAGAEPIAGEIVAGGPPPLAEFRALLLAVASGVSPAAATAG